MHQANLDSLWGVWHEETAPDANRAQAMLDIAKYGYLYSQPDSAYYYAQLSYDFASIMGLKKEMASALIIQGGSFYVRSDFQKAMENADQVGKVNISRSTYELIKNDPAFLFQSRGKVKVKGKGDIEMWFVAKANLQE